MSGKPDTVSRGYWSIKEVADRLRQFTSAMSFAKRTAPIALSPKDYDLVERWPKAGGQLGFVYAESGITFDGYRLRRHVGEGRYAKAGNEQVSI